MFSGTYLYNQLFLERTGTSIASFIQFATFKIPIIDAFDDLDGAPHDTLARTKFY